MFLKRLEIAGFKSFAERVSVDFVPGVTSVVGPNGSGKVILLMQFAGYLVNNLQNHYVVQRWRILFLQAVIRGERLMLLK